MSWSARPSLAGGLKLCVRPLDRGDMGALLDGRSAVRFHFMTMDYGRPYVWLGDRAPVRQQPN